jgi:hypothetical protein
MDKSAASFVLAMLNIKVLGKLSTAIQFLPVVTLLFAKALRALLPP